jgi:hypothetical protein
MKLRQGALISPGEALTDQALRRFFGNKPYLVYKEFPLRRVIDAQQGELTTGEWEYYTKASFDFVVCTRDSEQGFEIAIEFDGKQHRLRKQARKDALKDRLCFESGLPLIRVQRDCVETRENLTLLEYMLDLYSGEKAMEDLKQRGEVSDEEEYFIGTAFPAIEEVGKRLVHKGILPAIAMIFIEDHYGEEEAKKILWFRTSDKDLKVSVGRTGGRVYKASAQVEILQGSEYETPLLKVEREVRLSECSPNRDVVGIHTWHLAQGLATYSALLETERLVGKLGKRLWSKGKIQ